MGKNNVSNHRELSFDDEDSTDHVAQVLTSLNSGQYTKAREYLATLDKDTRTAVSRSVAVRTGVYL